MHAGWQNLSRRGGFPREGRAWWYLNDRRALRVEWGLLSNRWCVGLRFDPDENEVVGSFCIGLFSLYLSIGGLTRLLRAVLPSRESRFTPGLLLLEEREISIRFFDGGPWWLLWMDPDEAHSTDPRWRRGRLNIPDLMLGRMDYKARDLGPAETAAVWMPEGPYEAQFTPYEAVRTRRRWPRWPFHSIERSWQVNIPGGIPTEDEDGIYGLSVDGATLHEAAANVRERVLSSRKRDSGSRDWRPRELRPARR